MPAIYIVGDSTVENGTDPFHGWGWALHEFVVPNIAVENHAIAGRSSKSFLHEKRFEPICKQIKSGDMLLIQFGHNDEKDDEDLHTDPYSSFPETLNIYCDTALSAGALPVLITPVCRRYFVDHSMLYTHGEYPAAIRKLAAEKNLPLLDLKAASRKLFLHIGREELAEFFVELKPGDHPNYPNGHHDLSHFNAQGSKMIAELVSTLAKADHRCSSYFL